MSDLLNLLAVIHRDGGHHTDDVGLAQSLVDARAAWYDLHAQLATAKAALARAIIPRDPTAAVPLFDPNVINETFTVKSLDWPPPDGVLDSALDSGKRDWAAKGPLPLPTSEQDEALIDDLVRRGTLRGDPDATPKAFERVEVSGKPVSEVLLDDRDMENKGQKMNKVYGPHGGQGCPTGLDGLSVPEGYEVFESGSDTGAWYFSAIADSTNGYHRESDALEGVCAHAQHQRDIGAKIAIQELLESQCTGCRMGWEAMETENGGQLHINDGGYYHCNASWVAVLMLQRYDK